METTRRDAETTETTETEKVTTIPDPDVKTNDDSDKDDLDSGSPRQ